VEHGETLRADADRDDNAESSDRHETDGQDGRTTRRTGAMAQGTQGARKETPAQSERHGIAEPHDLSRAMPPQRLRLTRRPRSPSNTALIHSRTHPSMSSRVCLSLGNSAPWHIVIARRRLRCPGRVEPGRVESSRVESSRVESSRVEPARPPGTRENGASRGEQMESRRRPPPGRTRNRLPEWAGQKKGRGHSRKLLHPFCAGPGPAACRCVFVETGARLLPSGAILSKIPM